MKLTALLDLARHPPRAYHAPPSSKNPEDDTPVGLIAGFSVAMVVAAAVGIAAIWWFIGLYMRRRDMRRRDMRRHESAAAMAASEASAAPASHNHTRYEQRYMTDPSSMDTRTHRLPSITTTDSPRGGLGALGPSLSPLAPLALAPASVVDVLSDRRRRGRLPSPALCPRPVSGLVCASAISGRRCVVSQQTLPLLN
ncbi:hypothetical protein B0H14DRAFT_3468504 [Mycena olivaceomarginata]|nr:hypothetical protein B0H14DRAFT_3468504 [Mycena olivaceomarginata]